MNLQEALKKSNLKEVPNFKEWLQIRKLEKDINETVEAQTEWDKVLDEVAKKNGFKGKEELFKSMGGVDDDNPLKKKAIETLKAAKKEYKKNKE